MEVQFRRGLFKEPSATDKKLNFRTYHDTVMAVARLVQTADSGENIPIIRLMELDEDLPAYDEDAELDADDHKPYTNKKATPLYFDPESQTWKRDDKSQKVNIANPFAERAFSTGDRLVFLYLAQAASFVPLGGGTAIPVRRFKLRTTLTMGEAAWGEQLTFQDSVLRPNGTWFKVFDAFNEFYGTKDASCGVAWQLSDTPYDTPKCLWQWSEGEAIWTLLGSEYAHADSKCFAPDYEGTEDEETTETDCYYYSGETVQWEWKGGQWTQTEKCSKDADVSEEPEDPGNAEGETKDMPCYRKCAKVKRWELLRMVCDDFTGCCPEGDGEEESSASSQS